MSSSMEMPKYQCHKQVWALKIAAVIENPRGYELHFEDKRYAPIEVGLEWYAKHQPYKSPGYLVVYEDGYQSFSPAAAFEAGYTALTGLDAETKGVQLPTSQADVLQQLNGLIQQQREQLDAAETASKQENPLYQQRLFDEFAMAAMNGLIASNGFVVNEDIGPAAYEVASAMMREREKHKPDSKSDAR